MVKKRHRERDTVVDDSHQSKSNIPGGVDGDEPQTLDVTFDFFNFVSTDFHATKNLLKQLFDVDALDQDVSALADAIVAQDTIGSAVKDADEGRSGDGFGFLSLLRTQYDQATKDDGPRQAVGKVLTWLTGRAGPGPLSDFIHGSLQSRLEKDGLALVLGERMINCPAELAPPMYIFMMDELEAAVEDGEPYSFSHFLVLSKVYEEIESTIDNEDAEPRGKKGRLDDSNRNVQYFHAEDETLRTFAEHSMVFDYARVDGNGSADSRRAFSDKGVKTRGLVMVFTQSRFMEAIQSINSK